MGLGSIRGDAGSFRRNWHLLRIRWQKTENHHRISDGRKEYASVSGCNLNSRLVRVGYHDSRDAGGNVYGGDAIFSLHVWATYCTGIVGTDVRSSSLSTKIDQFI